MVFNVDNIQGDPELWVIKDYGPDNEDLTVEKLTEVFVIIYTYLKKGVKEPIEIYTFTTDFEQALKRFKLLPACKCLLKRVLTDDDDLIKLAHDGTKPKVEMTDELNTPETTIAIKEIMDRFNDDDVDRSGITVRELTDEEFSLLTEDTKTIITNGIAPVGLLRATPAEIATPASLPDPFNEISYNGEVGRDFKLTC